MQKSAERPVKAPTGHSELAPGVSVEDILANLADAFILLDRDGRILYANTEAERIFRATAQEFLGKTPWELWPSTAGTPLEREYRRTMEERAPAHLDYFLADGYNLWLEVHVYPCGPGIAVQFRDISERKRVESKLLEREVELTNFIDYAAMAIHCVGPDGTILWANQAELKLLGYSPAEYIGHNIMEFHVDQAVIAEVLDRHHRREEVDVFEARMRAKDGSIRYVAITSNVHWADGRFVYTRCFTQDITEQKRAAELREQLAAIVESSK